MQGEKTEERKKHQKKAQRADANYLLGFEIAPESSASAPSMFKDKHRGYSVHPDIVATSLL